MVREEKLLLLFGAAAVRWRKRRRLELESVRVVSVGRATTCWVEQLELVVRVAVRGEQLPRRKVAANKWLVG